MATSGNRNRALVIAGSLSLVAACLHIAIIFGGPDWYRTFGAGEQMAIMAARGDIYPTIVTIGIALVLSVWGLYAFAGAGIIRRLPFMRTALSLITGVYLLRGLGPFAVALALGGSMPAFWIWSSLIGTVFGLAYLLGTRRAWSSLG